jgi:hypothetical protein
MAICHPLFAICYLLSAIRYPPFAILPFAIRHSIIPAMPERLEADTSLLNISGGRPLPEDPPGFGAFAPPRKTARGREKDMLFLCLGLRSRAPVPPERYSELLDLAAATFFGSTGSITSALRQALAAVNQNLLDANANLRAGAPVQGGLVGAALRGEDFYAVQCGPGIVVAAHRAGVEHFPSLPSRPLGLSDNLDALYFHTVVREGEYFALSPSALSGWTDAALSGLGGLATLSGVAERLKETAGGDFAAMVGRFEPAGTPVSARPAPPPLVPASRPLQSLASLIRPRPQPAAESATPMPEVTLPPADLATEAAAPLPAPPAADIASAPPAAEPIPESPPSPEAAPAAPTESETVAPPGTDWPSLLQRAERFGGPEAPPHIPVIEEMTSAPSLPSPLQGDYSPRSEAERGGPGVRVVTDKLKHGLRAFARAFGITLTEATRGARKLLARMMPEGMLQQEGLFTIPNAVLMGMAIVIPLIVVAIVAVVYVQRGRAEQFNETLDQARREAIMGGIVAQTDPVGARPHWEAALEWLAQAEQLQPDNAEVITLQAEAQSQLDALDWITRLDFQPLVIGGLGETVKVKQISLSGSDVYALDASRNRVLRLVPTPASGYTIDPDFECASGTVGQFTIRELIDIGLILGPNALGSGDAVIALDTHGGLLYCAAGSKPSATYLPAPETGWVRPAALEVYADRLYILDPGGNEVWQYQASGGAFTQSPSRYFVNGASGLQDVIEFSIAGGDLFLLRQDGRVTNCTRPAIGAPPSCAENVQYADARPGRAPGDRLADVTAPVRFIYDPPPEPSMYLLDANSGGLYQLSLKLLFVTQYRSRFPMASPVTAAAIDASKRLYLAAGDNVYRAERP